MQEKNKKDKPSNTLPTDRTLRCSSIWVKDDAQIEKMVIGSLEAKGMDILQSFRICKNDIAPLVESRFVIMENKPLFFDRDTAALFPAFDAVQMPIVDTRKPLAREYEKFHLEELKGFTFGIMTFDECWKLFSKDAETPYFAERHLRAMGASPENQNYVLTEEVDGPKSHVVDINVMKERWWSDGDKVFIVPICRLRGKNAAPMQCGESMLAWMKSGLVPLGLTPEQQAKYVLLQKMYPQIEKYISTDPEDCIVFDMEIFCSDIIAGKLKKAGFDIEQTVAKIKTEKKCSSISSASLKKELCHCDEKRAHIEPYDEGILTDVQRGHWELYEAMADTSAEGVKAELEEPLIARPPQLDIGSGICAIDFGTKSTVVVYQDGEARMLRVGKGELKKAPTKDDYENPTVINLRDIQAFLQAYRGRSGRPFTEWEQATVSHQAADALKSPSDSSVYSSVFSELKQWAKEESGWSVLRDQKGITYDIKPYLKTGAMDDGQGDGDFDPIELYAYYLGLYINNMHRKICLDYIMSYPVNYPKDVRERIRQSFENGLRKSLPPSVLRDETLARMKRPIVNLVASEPAAYAVNALEQFGLQPNEVGEQVAYGVFDFGGGTTDFDFGIEYIPENRRRNFIIEQFGSNGDILLGGENILELLAYEVYKDNVSLMRENNVPFSLPSGCEDFAGSETLISKAKDADAHMNTRILAEKLRPIWERTEEYDALTGDAVPVDLFQRKKNGEVDAGTQAKVNLHLRLDANKLEQCIEKRIRRGVESFFQSMHSAFKDRSGFSSQTIHIFLAGNSCRSPVVKKLFDEFIEKEKEELKRSAAKEKGRELSAAEALKLYLPLDMSQSNTTSKLSGGKKHKATLSTENVTNDESTQKMSVQEKDSSAENAVQSTTQGMKTSDVDMSYDRRRTGKTGVAFGLLRCRPGGKDVKIINRNVDTMDEMRFPYYLGTVSRNQKFVVCVGKEVDYGAWVYFTTADESEFEIYFTSDPLSLQGELPIEKSIRIPCFLDDDEVSDSEEEAFGVYIRKADPHTIDYAVGRKTDFENFDSNKIKVHHQKL